MSLVRRCPECSELAPRCQCAANPNPLCRPGGLEDFEVIPRGAFLKAERRFQERGAWL